jgi:hypothetical protein
VQVCDTEVDRPSLRAPSVPLSLAGTLPASLPSAPGDASLPAVPGLPVSLPASPLAPSPPESVVPVVPSFDASSAPPSIGDVAFTIASAQPDIATSDVRIVVAAVQRKSRGGSGRSELIPDSCRSGPPARTKSYQGPTEVRRRRNSEIHTQAGPGLGSGPSVGKLGVCHTDDGARSQEDRAPVREQSCASNEPQLEA